MTEEQRKKISEDLLMGNLDARYVYCYNGENLTDEYDISASNNYLLICFFIEL